MRKLWIAAAVCAPLLAQMPQAQPGNNPLGKTRFPAAKKLEWKPAPVTKEPAPEEVKELRKLVIEVQPRVCAHVRRVDPSSATDPKIIAGPPKAFESKMPAVQTMPACDAR